MSVSSRRIDRERKTVGAMIQLYCQKKHHSKALCSECQELYDYAMKRLDKCLYGVNKPTCANCPIHCYKPSLREEIRAIMRFSGPKMALRHPILSFMHLVVDGRRKVADPRKQ